MSAFSNKIILMLLLVHWISVHQFQGPSFSSPVIWTVIFQVLYFQSTHCDVNYHAILHHLTQMPVCRCGTDVNQSPMTEVDFLDDDSPTNLLLTSLRLDQSSHWFTVTLSVLWRTVHCTLQVSNYLSCGFNFKLESWNNWKLASKASTVSNAIRWLIQLT